MGVPRLLLKAICTLSPPVSRRSRRCGRDEALPGHKPASFANFRGRTRGGFVSAAIARLMTEFAAQWKNALTASAGGTRGPPIAVLRPNAPQGLGPLFVIPKASNLLITGCCYQSTFTGWSMSTAKARNLEKLRSTMPGKIARVDRVCTDWLAGCPGCGEPLRFARTVLQISDQSELHTFECKPCGLSITSQAVLDLGGA
jgi:hypothetical protein